MKVILLVLAGLNLLAFALYGIDKWKAKRGACGSQVQDSHQHVCADLKHIPCQGDLPVLHLDLP